MKPRIYTMSSIMIDPLDDSTYNIKDTHTHIHTCTLTEKPEEDAIIIERKI